MPVCNRYTYKFIRLFLSQFVFPTITNVADNMIWTRGQKFLFTVDSFDVTLILYFIEMNIKKKKCFFD